MFLSIKICDKCNRIEVQSVLAHERKDGSTQQVKLKGRSLPILEHIHSLYIQFNEKHTQYSKGNKHDASSTKDQEPRRYTALVTEIHQQREKNHSHIPVCCLCFPFPHLSSSLHTTLPSHSHSNWSQVENCIHDHSSSCTCTRSYAFLRPVALTKGLLTT